MSILKINTPGPVYDVADFQRAFRTIELWAAENVNNPGDRVAASLNLTNLQTDGYGLRIGQVFAEHGAGTAYYLRIVRSGEWYLRGVSASGAVGSVTTTP